MALAETLRWTLLSVNGCARVDTAFVVAADLAEIAVVTVRGDLFGWSGLLLDFMTSSREGNQPKAPMQ